MHEISIGPGWCCLVNLLLWSDFLTLTLFVPSASWKERKKQSKISTSPIPLKDLCLVFTPRCAFLSVKFPYYCGLMHMPKQAVWYTSINAMWLQRHDPAAEFGPPKQRCCCASSEMTNSYLAYHVSAISSILFPYSRALCKPWASAVRSKPTPVAGMQLLWLLQETIDSRNHWAVSSMNPSANESSWRTHFFPPHWQSLAKLWKVASGKQ